MKWLQRIKAQRRARLIEKCRPTIEALTQHVGYFRDVQNIVDSGGKVEHVRELLRLGLVERSNDYSVMVVVRLTAEGKRVAGIMATPVGRGMLRYES